MQRPSFLPLLEEESGAQSSDSQTIVCPNCNIAISTATRQCTICNWKSENAWEHYQRLEELDNETRQPPQASEALSNAQQTGPTIEEVYDCPGCQQNLAKKCIEHTYGDDCKHDFDYNFGRVKPTIPVPYNAPNVVVTTAEPAVPRAAPTIPPALSANQLLFNRLLGTPNTSVPIAPVPTLDEDQAIFNKLKTFHQQKPVVLTTQNKAAPAIPRIGENRLTYWPGFSGHTKTRLSNSSDGLLVDCGAIGNLTGDGQQQRLSERAERAGFETTFKEMPRPLTVEGVGYGHQVAKRLACIPMTTPDGTIGVYETPIIPNSNIPSLLGLTTMEKHRAILDITGQTYIIPGKGKVEYKLPKGSRVLHLKKAPSGHLLLPCDQWESLSISQEDAKTAIQMEKAESWHCSFQIKDDPSEEGRAGSSALLNNEVS